MNNPKNEKKMTDGDDEMDKMEIFPHLPFVLNEQFQGGRLVSRLNDEFRQPLRGESEESLGKTRDGDRSASSSSSIQSK